MLSPPALELLPGSRGRCHLPWEGLYTPCLWGMSGCVNDSGWPWDEAALCWPQASRHWVAVKVCLPLLTVAIPQQSTAVPKLPERTHRGAELPRVAPELHAWFQAPRQTLGSAPGRNPERRQACSLHGQTGHLKACSSSPFRWSQPSISTQQAEPHTMPASVCSLS